MVIKAKAEIERLKATNNAVLVASMDKEIADLRSQLAEARGEK